MFNPNDNPIFYSNMTDDEVRDDDAEYEAMMQGAEPTALPIETPIIDTSELTPFDPNNGLIFTSEASEDELYADFALDCATYDAASHSEHGDQ